MRNILLLPLLAVVWGRVPATAQTITAVTTTQPTTAQDWVVTGTVRDKASHQPLPGTTVLVKGTTHGASTDAQGHYSLLVPKAAKAVLVFSTIGYVTVERPVGNSHSLNVNLAYD